MTTAWNRTMQTRSMGWMLLGVLIGLAAAPPAAARPTELDGSPIDRVVYRSYEANWRRYARFACEIDGQYAYFPAYDRRKPSSLGMSITEVQDENTETYEERRGNLVVKRSKSPPREDSEAFAKALPSLEVGSYGWLASAEVVRIINKDQMVVRSLWLVNNDKLRQQYLTDQKQMEKRNGGQADHDELRFKYKSRIELKEKQEDRDEGFTQTFRLIGFDTRGLRVGDRWQGANNEGFQVGVVRWETPEPDEERRRREEPRLVLSIIEEPMRSNPDEEGFKKLLAERGMTVTAFVELVRDLRENDRQNAEDRINNELLSPNEPDE